VDGWTTATRFASAVTVYAYANNHYQGHGPATVARFLELWSAKGLPELGKPRRLREPSLFD
jgi:hypothetical protein